MGNSSSSKQKNKGRSGSKGAPTRRSGGVARISVKHASKASASSDNPRFEQDDVVGELQRTSTTGSTLPPRPSFGQVPAAFSQPPYRYSNASSIAEDVVEDEETASKRVLVHDQLVAFYYDIDPQRLMTGNIDVDGIVDWAIKGPNGYVELNRMLKNKYGEDLLSHKSSQSPDAVDARLSTKKKAYTGMNRTSSQQQQVGMRRTASQQQPVEMRRTTSQQQQGEMRRTTSQQQQGEVVNSNSQQPVMTRSTSQQSASSANYNRLSRARPVSMVPTAIAPQNFPTTTMPSSNGSGTSGEILSDLELAEEIAKFLKENDPGALNSATQMELLEFAINYGLEFLNGRLKLKYGVGINREEGTRGSFVNTESYVQAVGVQAAPSSVLSEMTSVRLRSRASESAPSDRVRNRGSNVDASLERKWAQRAGGKGGAEASSSPCDNFRIDVTANSFGMCVCGFKKDLHVPGGRSASIVGESSNPERKFSQSSVRSREVSMGDSLRRAKPPAPRWSKAEEMSIRNRSISSSATIPRTVTEQPLSNSEENNPPKPKLAYEQYDVPPTPKFGSSPPPPDPLPTKAIAKVCDSYQLDLTPDGFGYCSRCGNSKLDHRNGTQAIK